MTLTLVSWNVDGFARVASSLPGIMTRLGSPDVLSLQEVRLRPQDTDDVGALERALPGYACAHALARDPQNASFRGGRTYGVATFVRASLRSEPGITFPWDREGRFVVTRLPELGMAIGNIYAVNGTDKAYFDHDRAHIDGTRHDFKRRFLTRVAEACARQRDEGDALVLAGDWNVSRAPLDATPRLRTEEPHATARAQLNEAFLPSLDLVDPFRERHPELRAFTWFNRQARGERLDAARVDYVLLSRSLLAAVREIGIHDAASERFGSDHAPVFARLST